ncbi:CLIP domain-containing serine protease C9-like [Armigeres subalbatus]|uniref:CLIP domain-containing serine protease C9-like n=1 Tax=Armigeres subalbatus TaxID=124917 RepID=UPI002ED14382
MFRVSIFGLMVAALVFPAAGESGFSDYRNSFISYERKGLDSCPFTYYIETCTDYAHMVLIDIPSKNDKPHDTPCIGAFISEKFILTSASCIGSSEPNELKLYAASNPNEALFVSSVHSHPDYNLAEGNDLAVLKLNSTISLSKNIAAACLWDTDSIEMYSKVQEIDYDSTLKKPMSNSTVCSGERKNECLKSSQELWCQRKSFTGFLQIRQLGQHKMHPMIASFGCNSQNEIVPIAKHMPWIREVTKSTNLEYNYTDVGLGEKCFKSDNVTGVCIPIETCPAAFRNIKDIKKGRTVSDQCGFDNRDILVCCSTEDMIKGPDTEAHFRDIVQDMEYCEMLYDEFRRTPEEHQLHSQVAIIDSQDSTNCSATLITARYLLTSALCVQGLDIKKTTIWLGLGNDIENVVQKNEIHSVLPHPKFSAKSNHYNVAVIKLRYPVLIQSSSVPACLWREKAKMPSDLSAVSVQGHDRSPTSVETSPLYYSDCRGLYNPDLVPSEMCVNHRSQQQCAPKEWENLCRQPGSGLFATLYYGDDMKPVTYIVGIYNSGYQCDKGGPALYTRVSEYHEWIKSVVYLDSQNSD